MRRPLLVLVALAAPAALAAQLPPNSARSVAMGGALTALARGYEAISWNPAQLAMPHQPNVSIGLLQFGGELANNAFSIGDITKYRDQNLTDADKQYLLSRIVHDDSTWSVNGVLGLGAVAVSVGPLAFSFTSNGYVQASASRDAVQFALDGNGGFIGTGNFFSLAGSGGNAWATSTLAGSYAMRFHSPLGPLAAGATLKRVWGNFLGMARDEGSQIGTDSVNAHGEAIYTEYANGNFNGIGDIFGKAPGTGWGIDLGGTLELTPQLQVSAVLVNAISGMSWKNDRLRYDATDYVLSLSPSGVVSDTTNTRTLTGSAIDADPVAAAFKDTLLQRSDFSRLLRGGIAYRMAGFTLGGDLQFRLSNGLDRHSDLAAGGGIEKIFFGVLPLRAGFRTDFQNSTAITGGTGIHLGPFALDLSAVAFLGSVHAGVAVAGGMGLTF